MYQQMSTYPKRLYCNSFFFLHIFIPFHNLPPPSFNLSSKLIIILPIMIYLTILLQEMHFVHCMYNISFHAFLPRVSPTKRGHLSTKPNPAARIGGEVIGGKNERSSARVEV